jgi:uncharacterized protein (DUF427 family)
MSLRLRDSFFRDLDALRHEPTEKRVRALLGDEAVVDSRRAVLVWEPKRIVASYAVPVEDVRAELVPAPAVPAQDGEPEAMMDGPPVLHPGIPFAVHSTAGEALALGGAEGAAFRPADPDLADHVILDFGAFDAWLEEDEPIVSHPRDPFHRIEILHSSREVRIERDGELLAASTRPYLLFETNLPTRFYLPREDVRTELLAPSEHRTRCAYKGEASYLSLDDEPNLVWSYEHPLRDAAEIAGRLAFFDERVDVVLDGERRPRPRTPWSKPA